MAATRRQPPSLFSCSMPPLSRNRRRILSSDAKVRLSTLPLRSTEDTAIHPSSSFILRTRLVSLSSDELLQSPFVLALSDSSVGSPPAAVSVARLSYFSFFYGDFTINRTTTKPLTPLSDLFSLCLLLRIPCLIRLTRRPSRQSPPHDRQSLSSLSHQAAAAFIPFLSPFSLLCALYQNQQQQ